MLNCTFKAIYFLHDAGTVAYPFKSPLMYRMHSKEIAKLSLSASKLFFTTLTSQKKHYSLDLWPCRLLVTKCIWIYSLDAWCSSDHNPGYVYFQIKLPQLALLSRISIQGGKDILKKRNDYWVKR